MIISQTPLRISFTGGGTDFQDFWSVEDGQVISSAIDKYIHVIIKERFDDLIVLNYTIREIVKSVDDIKHDLIRETMRITGIEKGVEIQTLADIPSEGSGLGSSSSVTVGLLNAFYAYQSEQVSPERLAREACQIEIDILQNPIGKQDQYIAAFGGIKRITFKPDGQVQVDPIRITVDNRRVWGSNLLLFFTNLTRRSSTILKDQKEKINDHREILRKMKNQVPLLNAILENNPPFDAAGNLFHEGWLLKRSLSEKISNTDIDGMYKTALDGGAFGGKISGAGGGGFLMLYVPRENQNRVRQALKNYRELPFLLERDGSKIIFNNRR
jgi:D-glycero-alpha-D-manno-heptose-7-phosphate kinase